jgi:hypothetical protein
MRSRLRLTTAPALGVMLLALLLPAANARAETVTPSCIETLAAPVTITLPGLTPPISPGDQFAFGLTSPSGLGAIFATVTNAAYTPAGYSATAVFDRATAAGPPIPPADGVLLVQLFTARGINTPIGRLKVGGCAPPAPAITARGPADGATGIPRSTGVVVAFDRPMDAASVRRALRLVRAFDGKRVAATVRLVGGGRVAVLFPGHLLAPLRRFVVTVSTAAADRGGIALAAPATWSFTTGIAVR